MSGEMWFVTCAESEGQFAVFGPLWSYEDAVEECNIDCDHAHFSGRTPPPPHVPVYMPIVYDPYERTDEFLRSMTWIAAQREQEAVT